MTSKAIYARIQEELYEKLKEHGDKIGQSISSTVEELIRYSLEQLSSGKSIDSLEKEIIDLKNKVQKLESDKAELQGTLETCKAKESIALAAQSHASALQQEMDNQNRQIEQLRNYLLAPVAVCRNCNTQLRLFDIGQKKCSYCGGWNLEWLPGYKPPLTNWETIRDAAAVVGVTTVVVALLNALDNSQHKS